MEIVVTFPGTGKRVDARTDGLVVHTDQPPGDGGEGSAPDPFTLFLASLGTCTGFYVLAFCQARNLPTDGIRVVERTESDRETGRLVRITLEVQVPPTFPERYRDAIARAGAACKVKKTIAAPPEITVTTSVVDAAAATSAT
jgi:ribosomal protein S12 methylthiotransferase accessory factor